MRIQKKKISCQESSMGSEDDNSTRGERRNILRSSYKGLLQ